MAKLDSTVVTLAIAGLVAFGVGYLVKIGKTGPGISTAGIQTTAIAQGASPKPQWAASATGRVEPQDGEVRISPQASGRIEEVIAKVNERVAGGDLLVRLESADAWDRLISARAEAQVRKRERDEEDATGPALEMRRAEDTLADAERGLFAARQAFDTAAAELRDGRGSVESVSDARNRMSTASDKVATDRAALQKLEARPNAPLPTRLESALSQARSDVSLAEAAYQRTRIRAPFEGTVLSVQARQGETAAPSAEGALLTIGDLSTMRVRAEVEERDVTKVRVGQRVVVRADAYPDRDFEGKVTSVAAALGSPRIASRGPRRPNDVEVLEVVAELDGSPPLLTGMRVDVFFKLDTATQSSGTGALAQK